MIMEIISKESLAITKDQEISFWSKVAVTDDAHECWEWNGARKPKGYGNVRINKKYLTSHRIAFILSNGPIISNYIVCHTCDNPSCCNPNHLMLGTIKSNASDMLMKGRQKKKIHAARGEKSASSKLCNSEVMEIRSAYESKQLNQYELAEKYNVSQFAISSIVRRKTWSHI